MKIFHEEYGDKFTIHFATINTFIPSYDLNIPT